MTTAFRRLLVLAGGLTLAVVAPNIATAQTAPDYPGTRAVEVPTQVAGVVIPRDTGVAPAVAGTQTARGGTQTARGAQGATGAAAPGGQTLPVTGGDIAGLVVIGVGAIAAGAILVRRSRARSA